jgi:hypothetical protein
MSIILCRIFAWIGRPGKDVHEGGLRVFLFPPSGRVTPCPGAGAMKDGNHPHPPSVDRRDSGMSSLGGRPSRPPFLRPYLVFPFVSFAWSFRLFFLLLRWRSSSFFRSIFLWLMIPHLSLLNVGAPSAHDTAGIDLLLPAPLRRIPDGWGQREVNARIAG